MTRNNRKKRARVLIVDDHPAVREALAMLIGRQADLEVCGETVRRVLEGKVYLSDAMVEKLLHRAVDGSQEEAARSPLDALADREFEVFRLIGQGVKRAEIAERLHLSVKTVETYRDRIREKLDLSDGTELAHYATKWLLENG